MSVRLRAVTVLLLCSLCRIGASERVLQVIQGDSAAPELGELISRAVRVEIERAGLIPVAPDDVAPRDGRPEYRLELSYHTTDDDAVPMLAVELSLTRADDTLIASASFTAAIDLALDSRVAEAVRSAIAEAAIGGERTAVTLVTNGSGDSTPGVGATAGPPPHGLAASARTSAVIVVGRASDYFRYGYVGALVAAYRPELSVMGFTAGIRALFAQLFPTVGLDAGEVLVVAAGPDLAIGTVAKRPARVELNISAGPAVLVVRLNGGPFMAKTVPYLAAGVEATVALGSVFSMGLELTYLVVFERVYPLMAFTPSIVFGLGP